MREEGRRRKGEGRRRRRGEGRGRRGGEGRGRRGSESKLRSKRKPEEERDREENDKLGADGHGLNIYQTSHNKKKDR